jgi:hypothetical protein
LNRQYISVPQNKRKYLINGLTMSIPENDPCMILGWSSTA